PGLPGVPHVVPVALPNHDRPVDVVLPAKLLARAEDDLRFAPGQPVLAFNEGDTLLRPPGEPHAVLFVFSQHGNVETGAERAPENRVLLVLLPSRSRFRVALAFLPSRDEAG